MVWQVNVLLENSSSRVFAILQAVFKGMATHGLPPSRSASPFSSSSNVAGLNGLSKMALVRLLQMLEVLTCMPQLMTLCWSMLLPHEACRLTNKLDMCTELWHLSACSSLLACMQHMHLDSLPPKAISRTA